MNPDRDSGVKAPPGSVLADIGRSLDAGDDAAARRLAESLHPADAADLLERVSATERERLVELLRGPFDPDILAELDDAIVEHVVDHLGADQAAEAVATMATDDAVEVVEALDADVRQAVLGGLPRTRRARIQEGLAWPEDSAGRLMRRNVVALRDDWNVGRAIDHLREADGLPDEFFDLFVVDRNHRPIGAIPLSRVLRTPRAAPLTDVADRDLPIIPADMDQEEVAFQFRQRDLISAPVVDADGRLLGAVTVDDVVDVIHEEHEEDFMALAGVGAEDNFFQAIMETTRSRFIWLMIHLAAAIAASAVISLYAGTIEELVALAILMPIVATMGGTAGIQALTVAVRAIAVKELTPMNALRAIRKELLVSGLNGLLFAALVGGVAWAWFASPALGGVIALAMLVNLVTAGFTGSVLPVMLQRAGFDPAVASSALLTSITDVVGFYVFLGLAAALLL